MNTLQPFRFQMVSDLHLEFIDGIPNIRPLCDYIFLLGDIGSPLKENYWNFIRDLSSKFIGVFIITGNHEYYGSSIPFIDNLIRTRIKGFNNVHFLNGRNGGIYRINDIVIFGTTLWSYIPDEHRIEITNTLNDYKLIQNFTTNMSNILFKDNVNWLTENFKTYRDSRKVVFTHHTPLLHNNTSYAPYENKGTNHAFSSDLSGLVKEAVAWGYGHTHYNHNGGGFIYNNSTYLLSNQGGYPQKPIQGYNSDIVYSL